MTKRNETAKIVKFVVRLSEEERLQLQRLVYKGKRAKSVVNRAWVLLKADADGPSREQLAQKSGLTVVAIYSIERGSCTPLWSTVKRLTEALDVPLSAFQECKLPQEAESR